MDVCLHLELFRLIIRQDFLESRHNHTINPESAAHFLKNKAFVSMLTLRRSTRGKKRIFVCGPIILVQISHASERVKATIAIRGRYDHQISIWDPVNEFFLIKNPVIKAKRPY